MRYVVGYTNSSRGKDAVRLASALAKGQDVQLEIVVVTPKPRVTYDMYSPDRSYFAHLEAQASEWLDDAMALVPDDVVAKPHHQFGESIAEGLINAASGDQREEAALIVVGASQRGVSGYFTIGSIASSLLHSSPVPVALAPAGYGAQHEKIVRLTCAMGTRPGAENLLDVAVKTAAQRQIELRLVSLLRLDQRFTHEPDLRLANAVEHTKALAKKAGESLSDGSVSTNVARGSTIEECVAQLDFDDNEIVLVGSSRLASRRRLFIGSVASKMLRVLPVPMVVVPRDYEEPGV